MSTTGSWVLQRSCTSSRAQNRGSDRIWKHFGSVRRMSARRLGPVRVKVERARLPVPDHPSSLIPLGHDIGSQTTQLGESLQEYG